MIERIVRRVVGARKVRGRGLRPSLEGLEGRMLLYSATGNHFAFGTRITLSIVPDGTNLAGQSSNMWATMDAKFGANKWEGAFLDAAAWWENVANVNVAWVGDDGSPFASGNFQQGDPNKGDIRIGGFAQSMSTLAFATMPPPSNGGSDAGDIFFNTSQPWSIGSGGYDLETVAIHEIGHALGLGHSTDPNAAMYPNYNVVKQVPNSDDIAGIRAIWGPRVEDYQAQAGSTGGFATAPNISSYTNANNQIILPFENVAVPSESYTFKITTPANASPNLSATVQSTNLSELSAIVQIYDANHVGLVQFRPGAGVYGETATVSIGNARPNTTYYVRVLAGTSGSAGAGSYALVVNMGNAAIPVIAPPNTQVAATADQGSGSMADSTGAAAIPAADPAATSAGGASTPVDVPSTIIFPTMTVLGDFLMAPGATEPRVYRVADFATAQAGSPTPTPVTTERDSPSDSSNSNRSIAGEDRGASDSSGEDRSSSVPMPWTTSAETTITIRQGRAPVVRAAHPSGSVAAQFRPAQDQPKIVKLGD